MSFALATLTHESRRYFAATLSLALAGILILAQVGLMSGIGEISTAMIDRSRADLLVLSPGARSFGDAGSLPARLKPRLFLHPEVVQVQPWEGSAATFSTLPEAERQVRQDVKVMSVDLDAEALTFPTDFPEHVRTALRVPFTVVVDRSVLGQLGLSVGDRAVLNRHLVTIAATVSTYPSVLKPTMFVSRDTLRLLDLTGSRTRVGPMLVKLRNPAEAAKTAEQLNQLGEGQFQAWTREELARANRRQFMRQQVIGLMISFSAFLGVIIGIGVTSQSMRSALMSEIPAFAAFRALGMSLASLRRLILSLALWIFGAACLIIVAAVSLLGLAAERYSIPFSQSPVAYLLVMGLLLGIVSMSSLSALRVLKLAQPMDLLR